MSRQKALDEIVEQITTAYKIEPNVKDGSIFVSHDDYSATFTVSSTSNSLFDLTLLYCGDVVMSELVSSYRLMEHLGMKLLPIIIKNSQRCYVL